jgi:hypothetical protein
MGWSSRGLGVWAILAAGSCSLFPDSPPIVRHVDGGAGGTSGSAGSSSGGAGGAGTAGGSGGTAGAAVEAGSGGAEAGAGGDAGVLERAYTAVVADCIEQVAATKSPNPDACAAFASSKDGPNELWVDLRQGSNRQFTGYLRFDVGGELAQRTLLGARVEITVTTFAGAVGHAPELWECAPFSRASLFVQEPALIGSSALAPAPGTVSKSQTVSYALPAAAVAASASAYFALVPVVAGGSGFWNLLGPEPPRLVVKYR